MSWYAVLAGKPAVVIHDQLHAKAVTVFCPIKRRRRWDPNLHKMVTKRIGVFGRYLFADVADPWALNANMRAGFINAQVIRFDSQNPCPIPSRVIAEIMAWADTAPILPGLTYKIACGPFAGLLAVIESVKGEECSAFVQGFRVRLRTADLDSEPVEG